MTGPHLRQTLLAAITLALAAGCRERDAPLPERERQRPVPQRADSELDCKHDRFCVPPPAVKPISPADPQFDTCNLYVPVPPSAAPYPASSLPMLRVRFDPERTRQERAQSSAACCYLWFEHCRGRPLMENGSPVLAEVRERSGYGLSMSSIHAGAPPHLRAALADHWLREASFEHTSILAFDRAARDLLDLGAPPSLIAETRRAQRDERRHARIAFGLASAYAQKRFAPGPLRPPPRPTPTLEAIAQTTFTEGCVAETIAACLLRAAAERARDPHLAAWISAVASDEERHATLAWKTVAWAIHQGGPAVHRAVQAAFLAVLASADEGAYTDTPTPSPDLESHGVLSPASRRAEALLALQTIILPCAGRLLRLDSAA